MEELKELIRIVSKQKTQNIKIVGDKSFEEDTLAYILYEAISSGHINSDHEGVLKLYKTDNKENRKKYSRLKHRLKDRLINSVFFIDLNQNQFSDFRTAYFNCYRLLANIKILQGKGAQGIYVKLSKRLLKNSKKFELTQIALECARALAIYYGSHNKNGKLLEESLSEVHSLLPVYSAEVESDQFMLSIYNKALFSSSSTQLEKIAKSYLTKLEKPKDQYHTTTLIFNYFFIKLISLDVSKNYIDIKKPVLKL